MLNITLTGEAFKAYSCWTAQTWLVTSDQLGVRDYAIMAMGLPGETGEIVEELVKSLAEGSPRISLLKELGDGAYYASRLFHAFELTPAEFGWSVPVHADAKLGNALAAIPKLTISVGKVCEVLKKLIRDGVPPEKLSDFKTKLLAGLNDYILAWMQVMAATGWTPQEAITLNMEKINDRQIRGVLQGSGNDR